MIRLGLAAALCVGTVRMEAQQVVQERVDLGVVSRIRNEATVRSRIDSLAYHLTEIIGPRLTNSPGNRRALDWAAAEMRGWGLTNVAVQPWDTAFGRGWERVSYAGRILEPISAPLLATPQGWSGSTPGTVTCPVVLLEAIDSSTIAKFGGKLRGACVMRAAPGAVAPEFDPIVRRTATDVLLQPGSTPPSGNPPRAGQFAAAQAEAARASAWLRGQALAALLQPSAWNYNILRTGGHPDGFLARDSVYNPTPALVVSKEQYGLVYRHVKAGRPVRLELNVQNRFVDGDRRGANVLGEIAGTDKAAEVVMLGAHIDSWHSGSGATDNAAGTVVMMEAVRILKTLGLPLRRTVRLGLWSGEEQGLLGSRAWVRMNRGQLANVSAYLNLDNGTGKIRGIWNQSNPAVTPIFEQILFPFRDAGVIGVRQGNTGSTDHIAFDAAGVPGFNFAQDPIEYSIRTHHSNTDTYDHLLIDDLKQAAAVVAWTVYSIANRDEMIPRKAAPVP